MLNDFHFIRPLWFIALIPLLAILWQLHRQKLSNSGWQHIIPQHLVNHLIQGTAIKQHRPFWLLVLGWLLVVTALAGPSWEKLPQPVYQTNTGKVIVMDMTMSMRSTDISPDRLTKARFKAIDLIERIDDSDMGLVAYSGDAFVISPLTADSKNLTALVPNLSPEIMPVSGSNPLSGLMLADTLLKNAGYARGEIFLLSDGIEADELSILNEFLRTTSHRISVLGIGTTEGAPVKQVGGELLKDSRGSIVIPKLNDTPLRRIATATGGVYSRITSTDIDIETLAKQETVSHEAKKDDQQQLQGDQFKEFGPYLVWLLLPLAAYAFRRGLVVCLLVGLSLGNSNDAQADWWQDLWQNQDQQALEQFSQENYADAAARFKDPQWKGSSLYKNGDYEGALSEYKKFTDADGWYNQGNAHAQLQQIDEGIAAYEKALELAPDMEDAKKNLALLKQLKQQQDQQDQQNQDQDQQQNQDQKNQQDQQGKDSKQDQSGQDQKDQQQQEQQDQKDQQQDSQNRQAEKDQQGEKDAQNRQQEQKEKEQEQMQEQKKPGEEKEGEESGEEQQLKPGEQQPTTEEKEQLQEIQQLMRKIPDDPSILLRNKMRLEYQKRKYQQQNSPPGAKSW